jgi:hypothetical protein
MLTLNAFVALAVASSPGGVPTCENPVGMWNNQLGSTMVIRSIDTSTGLVSGCYCSPSGTSSQWFLLTGFVNSQAPQTGKDNVRLMSWAVQWGQYGSITTWSGLCRSILGLPNISALWHLTRSNADQTWSHRLTDTDLFVPAVLSTCGAPPPSCGR